MTAETPDPGPLRRYFETLRLMAAAGPMPYATRDQALQVCDGIEADAEEFLAFDAEQDHEADHADLLTRIAYFDWLETTATDLAVARAALDEIEALHPRGVNTGRSMTRFHICKACGVPWPCPTLQIIRKAETIARRALGWPT